jgi:imidazolonepropionase-like amidohydrolase
VRCGRILDAEGHVFRNGVVLCEDGRIKAVGEDLSIPFGARVVDLPHGVMTPGLLDAFSHLGLAGDGQPVPACTPNQKIAEAIAFDDPMFGAATAAGLTTALVSGKDGGQLSGRIAAIKLGARDQAAMVVRAVAGQRFLVDGVGADAARPLQEQLDRAKKYRQTFIDYDKAVAEQKAGGKAEPPKAEPPKAPPTPPAAEDPLTGTWESTVEVPGGSPLKAYLELRLEGTAVTGRVRLVLGTRELPAQEITSGSFQAGKLKLEFRGTGSSATVEAEVKGEEMTGKVALPQMGEQNFTGKRTSKPASKPAPATAPATDAKSEAPKKPPVDEGLEPLRQCLDKTATLVVRCNRGPAIKAVVELLQKEQVPFVLHGADGLLDEADLLGASHPAVLLEPEIVREQDGELQNAAAMLADRGHPVLLGSGQCGGARFLPLHAAYAVRYGMSPVDALLAITRATAQAFQLDDRVGSLRKGKDADFVVFSGDPFEPTSRVLLVAVNGEIAIDNRSAATAEAGK